jgi:hypothetical protein
MGSSTYICPTVNLAAEGLVLMNCGRRIAA